MLGYLRLFIITKKGGAPRSKVSGTTGVEEFLLESIAYARIRINTYSHNSHYVKSMVIINQLLTHICALFDQINQEKVFAF